MNPSIVIYRLSRKFVNQRQDIPETARRVVYYTPAVGHHVGAWRQRIPSIAPCSLWQKTMLGR